MKETEGDRRRQNEGDKMQNRSKDVTRIKYNGELSKDDTIQSTETSMCR